MAIPGDDVGLDETVVYNKWVVASPALLQGNEVEWRRSARGERRCRLHVGDDMVFNNEILGSTLKGYETSTNRIHDHV